MKLMKIISLFLIVTLYTSCNHVDKRGTENISAILKRYFDEIPNNYDFIILKNKDCLSCEKSTENYISDLNRDVFIIAQEVRKVEEKRFYENKPFLMNENVHHIFNDSLSEIFCDKIELDLKTTILIKVEDISIVSSGYLRERNSIEDIMKFFKENE